MIKRALVLFLFLLAPTAVQAGGLEFPDLGTVAIGRGAAFVAKADNLTAFYYNPAGLTKSKGPNLILSANLVNMNLDFNRSGTANDVYIDGNSAVPCPDPNSFVCVANPSQDYADGRAGVKDYSTASLTHKIGPAPVLVFSYGDAFNVEGLALAIGLLPPSGFGGHGYEKNGAQRYVVKEANHLIIFPGVGVAYDVNRYFQIGAVFLSGIASVNQSVAIRPLPTLGDIAVNEDADGDAEMTMEAHDFFVPTAIIGAMSNPLDWLELGVSVRLPSMIEADGKLKYKAPNVPGHLGESHLVDGKDSVTVSQHFPLMVRAGARYIHERFDIEADFVWENYSSLSQFDLKMDAAIATPSEKEMPDGVIPKNFRDSFSVRLGGDVIIIPERLSVRLGGYWQSSAYPENYNTFSVDFPFAQQFGLGGGVTVHAASFLDVNLGYLHIFQPRVTVTEGIVQQQGTEYDKTGDGLYHIGNTVNNGTYDVSLNLFGLSLEGHF